MSIPTLTPSLLHSAADLPTLVLGPSLGTGSLALWGPAVPYLKEHFQLVAWDLPGHGESAPSTEEFSMGELAAASSRCSRHWKPTGHQPRRASCSTPACPSAGPSRCSWPRLPRRLCRAVGHLLGGKDRHPGRLEGARRARGQGRHPGGARRFRRTLVRPRIHRGQPGHLHRTAAQPAGSRSFLLRPRLPRPGRLRPARGTAVHKRPILAIAGAHESSARRQMPSSLRARPQRAAPPPSTPSRTWPRPRTRRRHPRCSSISSPRLPRRRPHEHLRTPPR